MTHTPRIATSRGYGTYRSYRLVCTCGTTSPWAHGRQAAELALERHRYEHHLEETTE